jgi:hypothetical protein
VLFAALAFLIPCSQGLWVEAGDDLKVAAPALTPAPKAVPLPAKRDPALGKARLRNGEALEPLAAPLSLKSPNDLPVAAARFEGLAAPGVQIRLKGDGSTGAGLRYRWVQTQGPTAELIDANQETARLTIPSGARTLGFLLVVSNESGMDSIPLTVPVEGRPQVATDSNLRADAGDDQIGVVGRQITLNGLRSEPRGKIGYRWIQVGGPAVRLKIEEGHVFTFVPTEPGTHRFVLVVAEGGVISEPDEVQVSVEFAGSKSARLPVESRIIPPPPGPEGLASVVQSALSSLEGGPAAAESLGQTFDGVAGRMNLFRSYDEAYSEISRRLDAIVPQDPAIRSRWIERLFAPITSRMVEEVRKAGLDLSTESGRAAALNEAQRARMIEIFRAVGDGSRAVSRAY